MSSKDNFVNIMKPKSGDSKVSIPVTFDYNGGKAEHSRTKKIWACILAVLGLLVGIGIMFSSDGFFLTNILFGLAIMYGVSIIIRFPLLKEHEIRNAMVELIEKDYKMSTKDMWGIISIDDEYPYYVHFRNGKTGLFVAYEKDVILGKGNDSEYNHHEAVGDAYNLAGSSKIDMCHVDYMATVGDDDRLDACFQSLGEVENPDVRDMLTRIYTNLKSEMDNMVTTFDVYVYTFRYSEATFWYHIKKVIACMLDANYVSFKILNAESLRSIPIDLMGMHEFSVVDACAASFGKERKANVVPISVTKSNGEFIKINKTQDEKKADLEEYVEQRRKNRESMKKKIKNKKADDLEDIDIFED